MPDVVVVDHPDTELHDPRHEVWVGVATPASEVAERVRVIRAELAARGARSVPGADHSDDVLAAVHDRLFLTFLQSAAERWVSGDYDELVGQQRVVPYVFPTAELLGGLPLRLPAATHALTGVYCYDTMTLVGPGTWQAARTAADLAQTAAELALAGRTAYALCRPPGHHATSGGYGGSCYLNNAAVAAQTMRDGGLDRVAVVDVDAHHGNGTQSIFYARDDVWYGSVHVDPGAGWFPHFLGFADETGSGAGEGFTCNMPLPPGSGDDPWLSAVHHLAAAATPQRAARGWWSHSGWTPPSTTPRARCGSAPRDSLRPAGYWPTSGCRPPWCRKAGTTCPPWGHWWRRYCRPSGRPRAPDPQSTDLLSTDPQGADPSGH
jgi:acetoin utilization deacetylase AcuC-like enzyme